MSTRYRVEIEPLSDSEGGGYLARVPELPGCLSDGATEHEALDNALKAIEEWIAHARAHGKDIPLPRMRERHPA